MTKLTFITTFLISSIASFSATANSEGEDLFNAHCEVCHGMSGGMNMKKRVAPPIAAVRMHYIGSYPEKSTFVTAISNWVQKQDPNKTLMRGAIRRFNIMPPVAVSENNARKIAAYIYEGNIEGPAGFRDHVQQQHKKGGKKFN